MNNTRIIFLPVPEKLVYGELGDFIINPDIPIPAEVPNNANEETLNIENLSVEMIVSGMLHVIEKKEAEQEWLDYYSEFVLFLRPDILDKLKEIKDNGLDDKNFLKAHNLIQKGKAKESLNHIRIFLERYPLVCNGWFLLGWALRLLGRWNDAEAALKKAIELAANNEGGIVSDAKNELAICLMETDRLAEAKQELESALTADPENVKIISNLGVLAAKSGDSDKAAAFFRTVLEIDSNDPFAKSYIESLA